MNRRSYNCCAVLSLLAGILLVGGCSATPAISQRQVQRVTGIRRVFLAPPSVEYIDSKTARRITPRGAKPNQLKASLIDEFQTDLNARHVAVVQQGNLAGLGGQYTANLRSIYQKLRIHSPSMTSDQQQCLLSIAKKTGASHILFSRMIVHVGPRGTWDPIFTGAITSNPSRLVLECQLYDIHAKRVVWTQTSQFRATSSKAKSDSDQMVHMALTTLHVAH